MKVQWQVRQTNAKIGRHLPPSPATGPHQPNGFLLKFLRKSWTCHKGHLSTQENLSTFPKQVQFRTGRDLAAWLGLVPRQHSSGARERLLGISKRGNSYLRRILIHGTRAFTSRVVRRRDDPRNQLENWIVAHLDKSHINKISVAVANKLARIIWAVLRKGSEFYSPPCRTT